MLGERRRRRRRRLFSLRAVGMELGLRHTPHEPHLLGIWGENEGKQAITPR